MRDGSTPVVVRREDYAPPAYLVRSVELSFDLEPAKTIVASRLALERHPDTPPGTPLKLHGEGLNLLRVMSGGQSVSFRHEEGLLVLDTPPAGDSFTLEIRNTCAPEKNTELSGLYTSGGGFFTQCEAEGFRRITFFPDRPDVMAPYTVTLRADRARYPVLLSNGNLVAQGELEGGRHYATWHDPFPKPSYLFALVAADLVAREQRIVARSGREHLLQVWVKRGDLDKTEYAMRSLMASVAWDEARFGLSPDLERFMIVAVDDFNMGAMENKGLNLFNTRYVLATPAMSTDADFEGVESVIAHEYFHNWTGNRVTCRDWFQLSLKEGLTVYRDQEFSMDMAGQASARAVRRIQNVLRLRSAQFPEDAGPMAHPVRPDSYTAIDNFYTATVYEKGAEVVRMQAELLGREGFARGMALYFQRHDGQAVTCDDFSQAMADANPGSALATRLAAFRRWYAQAGTPRVTARGHHDAQAGTYTLTLSQDCRATPGQPVKQPFVIPVRVGLVGRDGQALPLTLAGESEPGPQERLLVLEEASCSWVFSGVAQEPVPSLLRGFSAPVRLDDGLDEAGLRVLLAHDADAFNRWEAGQRLMLACMLQALHGGTEPVLDAPLADALRAVLRDAQLDPSLQALALTLPTQGYVAEQVDSVDPARIHAVHESLRAQLAQQLHEDWLAAWQAHAAPGVDSPGSRALSGLALSMLCLHAVRTGDAVWPGRAYQRVKDASNMTERLAALNALVHAHAELATPALERFHAQHRELPLALDKWFTAQALAPEPVGAGAGSAFQRAKALLQHPDFTLRNPNRARSLVGALCMANPAAFHRPDAAGYVFWAERVLELDAFNPQLAARMARALDHWRRLAEPMRGSAREALSRVAAAARLSPDTREIVNKALED
ncbi:MAG: aminopeptidase N [Rubrivivax sp.]